MSQRILIVGAKDDCPRIANVIDRLHGEGVTVVLAKEADIEELTNGPCFGELMQQTFTIRRAPALDRYSIIRNRMGKGEKRRRKKERGW